MNTFLPERSSDGQLERMLGYLRLDPQNQALSFDCIDLCLDQHELALAERLLSAAAGYWPGDPGVHNRAALAALRAGRPAAAIEELAPLLAAGATDAALRYNLAYACYQTGDYQRARDVLAPVVAAPVPLPGLAPLYALCLQQLGEIDAAVATAEQSLKNTPDDPELQGVLALLYFDASIKPDVCRSYVAAALHALPEHPMALTAASALALMDEEPVSALAYAHQIVARNPADGRAWSSAGLAYLYQADVNAACDALEQAVQRMPEHIGTWHALAWARLLQDDVGGAKACYQAALALDRSFGETQGGLAIIAWLEGDSARAESLMQRAQRLAPGGLTLQYLKLLQLQQTGDLSAVQAFLRDALRRVPSFKGDSVLDLMMRMGRPKPQADAEPTL